MTATRAASDIWWRNVVDTARPAYFVGQTAPRKQVACDLDAPQPLPYRYLYK